MLVSANLICPHCGVPLSTQQGDTIHPGDPAYGISVYCANITCGPQEVAGHGDNIPQAFRVIQEKYQKSVDNS